MTLQVSKALVLIKPDAFERGVVEELVIQLLEKFRLLNIKQTIFSETLFAAHYAEHVDKPFYHELRAAMVNKDVIALHLEALTIVFGDCVRTFCQKIRSRYVDPTYIGSRNLIHCSDSDEAGTREIEIWFGTKILVRNFPVEMKK